MNKNKLGITITSIAVMVLIISFLTATITISVNKTLKGSKLRAFATEISYIQDTVSYKIKATSSLDYILQDITITPSSNILSTQFSGETVTNGQVILHSLDLEKLGIEKTVYGKEKTSDDLYAMSLETYRVYYIAGYDSGDTVYYCLTEELQEMISDSSAPDIVSSNIVFEPNYLGYTNQPIQVTIKIPTSINTSTVTVTTNINQITNSSFVLSDSYNEIIVNTGNYAGNYIITVEYTLDGSSKTQTYEVNSYDNIAPVISVGSQVFDPNDVSYAYLNDVQATDSGKVKKIMYTDVELTAEQANSYFKNSGDVVVNNKIRMLPKDENYTIYAEDYAGNYSIVVVENTINFVTLPSTLQIGDLVEYTPTASATGKYTGATYVKDTVTTSATYNTYIESTTTYTPGSMTWVYLGQDEDGNILLTSQEATSFTMTIAGQDGFVTGPARMDTLCNTLYGNSQYGRARNMKIEDVNRVLEYNGALGTYYDLSTTMVVTPTLKTLGTIEEEYGEKITNRVTPRLYPTAFEDYLSNYYGYTGKVYKGTTTNEYKVIFTKADGTTNQSIYFLSSSAQYAHFGNNYAYFRLRVVADGLVTGDAVFRSNGYEYSSPCALRPVIVVKPNIKFGEKNASGEWTLVNR